MWIKVAAIIILILAVCVGAAIVYGSLRWAARTKVLRARLEAARLPIRPIVFDSHEIDALPAAVQRYFRTVLQEGQPLVSAAQVTHRGTFRVSVASDKWSDFTSTQRIITQRPGFDWDARIVMMPGINVYVHDAYTSGEGILHAAMLGLVTLADIRGTRDAAQGELMRFLAESAWYPTRLLPSQGILWETIDDSSARATLQDGDTTVSLDFRFGGDGLISTIHAAARARLVNGKLEYAPWEVRLWAYELRDGMLVPLEGEVSWKLPDGVQPYWRGRATGIVYEFAQ